MKDDKPRIRIIHLMILAAILAVGLAGLPATAAIAFTVIEMLLGALYLFGLLKLRELLVAMGILLALFAANWRWR